MSNLCGKVLGLENVMSIEKQELNILLGLSALLARRQFKFFS